MRARKKKNTIPRLKRCEELLSDKISPPERKKICLEIGCGKGQFITGLAKKHPDIEYYAMERVPDVIVMAAEKGLAEGLTNLHFLFRRTPPLCRKSVRTTRMRRYIFELLRPMAEKKALRSAAYGQKISRNI